MDIPTISSGLEPFLLVEHSCSSPLTPSSVSEHLAQQNQYDMILCVENLNNPQGNLSELKKTSCNIQKSIVLLYNSNE